MAPSNTGRREALTRFQRVFSYSQMFMFILSYMSSWEAIVTCVVETPTSLHPCD